MIHAAYYTINVRDSPLARHCDTTLTPARGDGDLPQCGRCARNGRECTRRHRGTQFRQAKGGESRTRFPRNQVWLKPPPRGEVRDAISKSRLLTQWFPVDFVLESGSGDDGLVIESTDDRYPERGLPFLENNATTPESPSFSQTQHSIQEEYRAPSHRSQTEGNGAEKYQPVGKKRDARTGQRTWPLRNPQEASLLKQFVDHISSFVSIIFARNGVFL